MFKIMTKKKLDKYNNNSFKTNKNNNNNNDKTIGNNKV